MWVQYDKRRLGETTPPENYGAWRREEVEACYVALKKRSIMERRVSDTGIRESSLVIKKLTVGNRTLATAAGQISLQGQK